MWPWWQWYVLTLPSSHTNYLKAWLWFYLWFGVFPFFFLFKNFCGKTWNTINLFMSLFNIIAQLRYLLHIPNNELQIITKKFSHMSSFYQYEKKRYLNSIKVHFYLTMNFHISFLCIVQPEINKGHRKIHFLPIFI